MTTAATAPQRPARFAVVQPNAELNVAEQWALRVTR